MMMEWNSACPEDFVMRMPGEAHEMTNGYGGASRGEGGNAWTDMGEGAGNTFLL